MQREKMEFDVVIVGAGPAGLSAAIRLKQLAKASQHNLEIAILEKGANVGAHILSGAVLEPRALNELLPDWQMRDPPPMTPVTEDHFYFLTKNKSFTLFTPPPMRNHGNTIVSLGQLCRWLATQAEAMGINIFPGFPAAELLFADDGSVKGVITGDMGISKEGAQGPNYQAGIEIQAKQTLFSEGCRGSLSERLMKHFNLRDGVQAQTYGIGIKELWRVTPEQHQLGKVVHTVGWPLDNKTYGGSFIYHLHDHKVAAGFVIGLDYQNPWLSPFDEMQRFKTHPALKKLFVGGERLEYGARALNEGGLQSMPKLSFPGGALIGDCAGFLNVAKIKGTHTAMKSGMLAAEATFELLTNKSNDNEIVSYEKNLRQSWIYKELHKVRNIRPAFHWGLWPGLAYAACDYILFRGDAPWTLKHTSDHKSLKKAANMKTIEYPKPDGKITFDKLSSLQLSNVYHEENQPCHLILNDKSVAIDYNLKEFAAPEQRYCPANVYEIIEGPDKSPYLQINAQNCVHCKTCDIKDPKQNIKWQTPEGGGGPNYQEM